MSSISAARRFQTWVGQPSNLDRCQRCHRPRSAHGPDWTCPAATSDQWSPPDRLAVVPLTAGIVLTLTGLILRLVAGSSVSPGEAALMADGFLLGAVLIVAGVMLPGRRR